jgi:tetratricopeptide (TPR) repeat protein
VALHGIGWIYALMGDNEKALDYFMQSLALRQKVKDRRGEAVTLVGIGKVYSHLGENTQALEYLNRALEILRDIGDHYAEADAISNIGWVDSSLNDYSEALEHFNTALTMRRQLGDRTGEATTLYGISQIERRLAKPQDARLHLEAALDIIESLRTKGASQQLRISYYASVQDYYVTYIDLLMQLHKQQPGAGYDSAALYASERARARSLLDLLIESQFDIHQGVDAPLLGKERELQQQLNAAANRQ